MDVPLSIVNAENALTLTFLATDTNTNEPYPGGRGVLRIYGGGSQIFFNFNQGVFYE